MARGTKVAPGDQRGDQLVEKGGGQKSNVVINVVISLSKKGGQKSNVVINVVINSSKKGGQKSNVVIKY